METANIQTLDELEFAIFCIENIAIHQGTRGDLVYDALAQKSNILQQYIIPCYDVLHTQGKTYIVNDILEVMEEKGVSL